MFSEGSQSQFANATVNGKWAGYTYDALGQLIRVNDRSDTRAGSTGSTRVYEYDRGGNILSKKLYPYADTSSDPLLTTRFTYGNANWKDQLTALDGVAITYDAIGNPLNDGTWTYTWQNGRQLAAMRKSGMEVSFRYNANGLRTHKIVNGVVTKYTLHGKNVVHMTKGNDDLHFFYDAQNRPAVVVYNGTAYAYVKNLQGDVIAILDSAGAVVVSYAYDAWGQPIGKAGTLASTLGTVQPFRYRGYVYDEETGLYYLRSRYYNFCNMRFINADSVMTKNLFSYCANSVPSQLDADGQIGLLAFAGSVACAICIMEHKIIISKTADSFLGEKGYHVANILFQHGIWHCGYDFTDKTTDIELLDSVNYVKSQIASDSQTYEMLRPYIEKMEAGTTLYTGEIKYQYTQGDLYYALQHVTCYANISKEKDGSWSARVQITDVYDFTEIRLAFSLGALANDLGVVLQNVGSLQPFNIDLTVMLESKPET